MKKKKKKKKEKTKLEQGTENSKIIITVLHLMTNNVCSYNVCDKKR